MKRTFLPFVLLFCFGSQLTFAQWSNDPAPVLTTGNAKIEKLFPYLVFDITGISNYGGNIFKKDDATEAYRFYNTSRNEFYWANSAVFNDSDGTGFALSLDLDKQDMSPTSPGFFQIGSKGGMHLDFDANEIQAKENETNSQTLYLNYRGGDVSLGTDEFYYDDTKEKIGIGTNNPNAKLHIKGNAGNNLRVTSTKPDLTFYNETEYLGQFMHDGYHMHITNGKYGHMRFSTDAQLRMQITNDGNVGIGNIYPSYKFEVYGDGNFTGELTAASDLKLKKNIKEIENASKILSKLHPVHYNFRTDEFPDLNLSEDQRWGLIAQEVELILPALVSNNALTDGNEQGKTQFKSVNYIDLIPILIRSNQEMQTEINSLKSEVARLAKSNQ